MNILQLQQGGKWRVKKQFFFLGGGGDVLAVSISLKY